MAEHVIESPGELAINSKPVRSLKVQVMLQLIVEDPKAYLRQLKSRLALKEGLPESQQRLIFSVPQSVEGDSSDPQSPRRAEDIVEELGSWQAILYQNGRAIGRLLAPQLYSAQTREEFPLQLTRGCERATSGVVVEIISVVYSHWQPAWLKGQKPPKLLYLPVDSTFTSSEYRLQVIGRSGGRPFVVPFAYRFSGRDVSIALGLEAQRTDYVRRHQLRRGASHAAGASRDLAVECGQGVLRRVLLWLFSDRFGLEGFTALFDAEDQPAWLKSVALRFAVVASTLFDDAAPEGAQQSMQSEWYRMEPTKDQPVADEVQTPSLQAQAQIAKDGWLPKMGAPVGSSGAKKGKQAKLRGQQGSPPRRQAAAAAVGVPEKPQGRGTAGSDPQGSGVSAVQQESGGSARDSATDAAFRETPVQRDVSEGHPGAHHRLSRPATTSLPGPDPDQRGAWSAARPSAGQQQRGSSGQESSLQREATGRTGRLLAPGKAVQAQPAGAASREGGTSGVVEAGSSDVAGQAVLPDWKLQGTLPSPAGPLHLGERQAAKPVRTVGDRRGTFDASRSLPKAAPLASSTAGESRSDDSLVTASSEVGLSGEAAGAGPSPRPSASLGRDSSSGGASFLTFGSFDSEAPSGEDEPRGAAESQRDPANGFSVAAAPPIAADDGVARPGSALPLIAPMAMDAGTQQELAAMLAAGGSKGLGDHQRTALGRTSLAAELQQRNMRPYDPLSMVGSPISPKACGGAWRTAAPTEAPGLALGSTSSSQSGGSTEGANPVATIDRTPAVGREGLQPAPGEPSGTSHPTVANGIAQLRLRSPSGQYHAPGTAVVLPTGQAAGEWPTAATPASSGAQTRSGTPPPPQTGRLFEAPNLNGFIPAMGQPPGRGGSLQREELSTANTHQLRGPPAYLLRHDGQGRAALHDATAELGVRAPPMDQRQARGTNSIDPGLVRMLTPPPPPPPPRTPPPVRHTDFDMSSLGIERQSSFQVPSPSAHSAFEQYGLPTNDMERLMSCITPVLELAGELARGPEARDALRLSDVWRFFEESSVYGREVYTRSGQRGPALAYYTPTLSAIRILLPCKLKEGQDPAVHARPLVEHFESELPFNREPFADAVASVVGASRQGGADGDLLLAALHPASWFAVAWYPVYRIPDAPLTAKFLTYHSLRPVPACCTFFGAADPALGGRTPDGAETSPLCAPIVGLKCAERRGEAWFESYYRSDSGEWERRYQHLQVCAQSLSAGKPLRLLGKDGGWVSPRQSHGDLEWFMRHP